ncbi:MAG: RNA polymerase sigma-70 factor [Mangrovibacterium sp.]
MVIKKNAYGFSKAEFEVFFKKYYKLALCVAIRLTHEPAASEDIVHDIFLRLWESAEVLHPGDSLKYLLLKAVKNKSLNYLRNRKNNQELDSDRLAFTEENEDFEPDERISRILTQIENLPPGCRKIFDLVIFGGKKYREAASLLGVSVNTVKTQMGIAYKQLRKIF